jgi:hypothetical protein
VRHEVHIENPAGIAPQDLIFTDGEEIHGMGICPGHPHVVVEHEDPHPWLVEDLKGLS